MHAVVLAVLHILQMACDSFGPNQLRMNRTSVGTVAETRVIIRYFTAPLACCSSLFSCCWC